MNLKTIIRKVLNEEITKESVVCDECGWSWKLSEGGNDPYTCHKCGNENSVNESLFARRRVPTEQMDKEFEESLDTVSKRVTHFMRVGKTFSFRGFESTILSMTMDGFHGELSNFGMQNFPYEEVYEFIKKRYSDAIKERYYKLFPQQSEMSESELTEKCWKGYTQKGMKTMFGKRYPNCVKKK